MRPKISRTTLLLCRKLTLRGALLGALLAQSGAAVAQQPAADWKLSPVISTHKLVATAPGRLEHFGATPVQLRAARGEWESFQVVVTAGATDLERVQLQPTGMATVGADNIAPAQFDIYRANYVFVPRPSGNKRLEQLWWPDALIPLALAPKSVPKGTSAVFWVTLRVPESAAAGTYFGELDVTANGGARRLALTLEVQNFTMPAPTFRANGALYYDMVRDWYSKNLSKTFTETQWTAQKKNYYNFLLDYRINAYDLPVDWDAPEAQSILQDPRVLSVRTPRLDQPQFDLALGALRASKTLHKAYYYWHDEPSPEVYPAIKEATAKLGPLGIKHCVTLHPNQSLQGAVDIWCPNIGDFFGIGHLDQEALGAERKLGRETWFYTMVEPRHPYPTWLVDDDGGAVRDYSEIMFRFGISGFVYSMVHGWGPRPLEDLTSYAGTSGDGTLLYPSEIVGGVGPMPSIRLMLLRDALEEWELLQFRQRKSGERIRFLRPLSSIPPGMPPNKKLLFGGQIPGQNPAGTATRAAPKVDGMLDDAAWNPSTQWETGFGRSASPALETVPLPSTKCWVAVKANNLYVALRANGAPAGEWLGVELSPANLTAQPEKLRIVLTAKGNLAVERHTREGHFKVEVPGLEAKLRLEPSFWNVEMKIPLEALGYGSLLRFNAMRRTTAGPAATKVTLRASATAGDPWGAPLLKVR